jgi:serine/threonine-protein phosphatase PGAM5
MEQYKHQLCYDTNQRVFLSDSLQQGLNNNSKTSQQQPSRVVAESSWDYNWDVSVNDAKDLSSIADRTLVLVRHGQYDLNTGHLTALGREQAAMTGQRLKEANLSYTELIHSTMDRATETANIIRTYLPTVDIRADELLVEGGPVPPLPTINYWHLPDKTYHVDGPRLEAAFRKYFYRPNHNHKQQTFQILVAHGNIFRFFTLRALQLSRRAWMRVFIAHASITMLHIRPDGTVSLTKLGDAGHFPHHKVTY